MFGAKDSHFAAIVTGDVILIRRNDYLYKSKSFLYVHKY